MNYVRKMSFLFVRVFWSYMLYEPQFWSCQGNLWRSTTWLITHILIFIECDINIFSQIEYHNGLPDFSLELTM